MLNWRFLTLSCLIVSCLVEGDIALQVNGTITMDNTTDLATVSSGDLLVFTFTAKFDLTYDSLDFMISIDGDTLEFNNETSIENVDWILSDDAGYTVAKNSTSVSFEESWKLLSPYDAQPVYLLNFTTGLKAGVWSFKGNHKMTIKDDVSPGSLVRCVMTFTSLLSPYDARSRTLSSSYLIVPYAEVTVENQSALVQPIMGIFATHVALTSSRDLLGCVLEYFTPPEMASKEVRLTVQQVSIVVNKTYGVSSNTLDILDNVKGYKISSLGSYQNNIGVLKLPTVPLSNSSNMLVLTALFSVRVEDYSQLQNGDQWPISMGATFNENVMWVGEIDVTIEAPEIRLPSLEISVQQLGQCASDKSTAATVKVVVSHSPTSTATAYNVTVNIYLPDYILMKSKTFTEPRENAITVSQSETVVTAEITRLTFSDPFVLTMTLDLDLSDLAVREATYRVISAETIYNDRWSNVTDLMTDTVYMSVTVNQVCSKPLTWSSNSTCQCDYNATLYSCACCVANACACGEVRPSACAPCEEMWRCAPYKKEFEAVSYLSDFSILCDAFNKRRGGASGVSCHKKLPTNPPRYLEISPRVSVVTGSDSLTGDLVGVANNGLAYVISKDLGTTWTSITDEDYLQMTRNGSFVWASFSW